MNDARRGRSWWGLVVALAALPVVILGFLGWMAVSAAVVSRDFLGGNPEEVPCAEALAFGGARLPQGAQQVGACEVTAWLDTHYSAEFRMPRAEVRDWLADTYLYAPDPDTEFCLDDADLCLELDFMVHSDPEVSADAVQVYVTYEDADTARVRFSAFTV
ncbi:hypothetical protein SSP24_39270 [Streptomyces spinoverrucosus]|uniref:Uncharacterized protein n=1 Tax=Streptomyces spinoverrucosus TaxID=284043 RepID=A0A4Y3VGQ2_9ACTN|nr:hypothetical protein [Streptomyces spinoverrucosus]GEC06272.1 hypothetical protein SSP24_39270 [Streptomyces spinoverrucosus]GHB75818.1 hypothetical protein GCM10010397_52840 [Streptomyces spinoverrucosus]